MEARWIRTYRPNRDAFDQRPTVLNGGTLSADPADFEIFVTTALMKRGNVVIERVVQLTDGLEKARYTRNRIHEAEQAEQRS